MARRRTDDDEPPSRPKPRNDAYVGLLAVTFLALAGAAVMLYMDFEALNAQPVPAKADVTVAPLPVAGTRSAAPADAPTPPGDTPPK